MHSEPIFILQQVMKMVIKGTWSHFSLHLVSMKMKRKELITLFQGCEKHENEMKSTHNPFSRL